MKKLLFFAGLMVAVGSIGGTIATVHAQTAPTLTLSQTAAIEQQLDVAKATLVNLEQQTGMIPAGDSVWIPSTVSVTRPVAVVTRPVAVSVSSDVPATPAVSAVSAPAAPATVTTPVTTAVPQTAQASSFWAFTKAHWPTIVIVLLVIAILAILFWPEKETVRTVSTGSAAAGKPTSAPAPTATATLSHDAVPDPLPPMSTMAGDNSAPAPATPVASAVAAPAQK